MRHEQTRKFVILTRHQGGDAGKVCSSGAPTSNTSLYLSFDLFINKAFYVSIYLANLAIFLEDLSDIKCYVNGLSRIRRMGEHSQYCLTGLCCKGLINTKKHGVSFLLNENLAGKVEGFLNSNKRAAEMIVKLNRRWSFKLLVSCAPTRAKNNDQVDKFHEYVTVAVKEHYTQPSEVMGDFDTDVERKIVKDTAVGRYRTGRRSERDQLTGLAGETCVVLNLLFYKETEQEMDVGKRS